jgi:hypothetical protein
MLGYQNWAAWNGDRVSYLAASHLLLFRRQPLLQGCVLQVGEGFRGGQPSGCTALHIDTGLVTGSHQHAAQTVKQLQRSQAWWNPRALSAACLIFVSSVTLTATSLRQEVILLRDHPDIVRRNRPLGERTIGG